MTAYSSRLRRDGTAIYLFHGVIEKQTTPVRNYTRKHLPVDDFAAILRDLSQHGTAVSMEEVRAGTDDGRALPPNAFAITFDDGFENNYTIAAPVLSDMGIPATFYITTDFIENNTMSWIDRIELAVEQSPPAAVRLPFGERRFDGAESKRAVLDEIRFHVKKDPALNAGDVASDVQRQLIGEEVFSTDHVLDRKMNWDQVRSLGTAGDFIVGGHSHTHPILSFLDDGALDREVETSLSLLERNTGETPTHYSYPEGQAHCYDDRVIGALKAAGIRCCPTAEDGTNPPGTDLFLLKRIMVA